jgi:hypothetical protein
MLNSLANCQAFELAAGDANEKMKQENNILNILRYCLHPRVTVSGTVSSKFTLASTHPMDRPFNVYRKPCTQNSLLQRAIL